MRLPLVSLTILALEATWIFVLSLRAKPNIFVPTRRPMLKASGKKNKSYIYPNVNFFSLFSNNTYQFKRGTTEVRTTKVIPLDVESVDTFHIAADGTKKKVGEKMDTA